MDTIIVGTGFSGLGMAIALKKAGRNDFVLLEKADELGGTWRDNRYPGCACDIPSHLYSYSFEPNPDWTRSFAPQLEILDYLRRCADKYQLRPHIRFGASVTRAEFDEAGACWRVHTACGQEFTARYLVFGIGALHRPAYPDLEGLSRFQGKLFHSAEWDHDYALGGKRVAVIGTGASAIQFVPRIAGEAGRLHLFQRTPPWVLPRPDRAVSERARRLYRAVPAMQRLHRSWIYWMLELRVLGFTMHPGAMKVAAALGRRHIRRQVRDPALRVALTPSYMPGCKRILMADDYYPVFNRDNVELVTDGIAEVRDHSIMTRDGTERQVDAIILGTGFRVTDLLTPLAVLGRGGADLNQAWRDGMKAFLGTTISGFPNLFMLVGPNTGLGHNSMIFMIESQIRYALRCMQAVEARAAGFADVLPEVQEEYNRHLQPRLKSAVWGSGCRSWYLDDSGRNSTLWPGFTFEFWLRTRRLHARDYAFAPGPPAER